jgi:hypothetical protein
MEHSRWAGALLLAVLALGAAAGGERPECPPQGSFLQRFHPVGGWHPYGGGLLFWWNPRCFPRCGTPDDYCRKKLPHVCWPAYPPYYTYGLPPAHKTPPAGDCRPCHP